MAARRKNNQSPPFLTPFELGGVRADLSVTRSRTHTPPSTLVRFHTPLALAHTPLVYLERGREPEPLDSHATASRVMTPCVCMLVVSVNALTPACAWGSRSLRESRRLGPLSGSLYSRLCRSTSVHAIAAPVLGFRRVCAFDAFCVSEGGRVSESSQHTVTSRK